MKAYNFFPLVLFLLFFSCQPFEKRTTDANIAFYDSIKHLTGLEFQPVINEADSVQVWFYNNPDGDEKRYTRYYKWVVSGDQATVGIFKKSINKNFERLERKKDCRSEGKIFFYKNENPLQTVYFSNRGDSCNHFYFISDGWFYYMPMDSISANVLKEFKAAAIEPIFP
jgi:hypothetical protein